MLEIGMSTRVSHLATRLLTSRTTPPFGMLKQCTLSSLRFGFLIGAIILYALFGAPTPDSLGLPEIIIAVMLCLSISPTVFAAKANSRPQPPWTPPALRLLLYCALIPLAFGIILGNAPTLIARDMIALVFLVLPLFYLPLLQDQPKRFMYLHCACLTCGVIFSLRALAQIYNLGPLSLIAADSLSYLANSPLVLLSAIYMSGRLLEPSSIKKRAAGLFMLCILLITMAVHLQRGALGLFALAFLILLGRTVITSPARALPYLAALAALGVYFYEPAAHIIGALLYKTDNHGVLNMRAEEWHAVWERINASPATLLFGAGWGAQYASPAVGNMMVNYTHGFLSYALLKTGLLGLGLSLVYITALIKDFFQRNQGRITALLLALLAPLALDILLYASFKSFDFGLLLLLIAFAPAFLAVKQQQSLVTSGKSL